MSYDVEVYSIEPLRDHELRAFIERDTPLHAEIDGRFGLIYVSADSEGDELFSVGGPHAVEIEDIPVEVSTVLLGARWMYHIGAEGIRGSGPEQALRFAKRLARATAGAVLDQRGGAIWTKTGSRKMPRPTCDERVRAINVTWYCRRRDLPVDAATQFVGQVQRFLPEALPRRFGEREPLDGRWEESGIDGFAEAWAQSRLAIVFRGSAPCVRGLFGAGTFAKNPHPFWSSSLTFFAEPFDKPAWRDSLRALFVGVADALPVFYASAEVSSDHLWSGRELHSDRETEWPILPVRVGGGWMGLPPLPTWWLWLGEPYGQYHAALPTDRTRPTARGVFYSAADQPLGHSQLEPLSTWLPQALFAKRLPSPKGLYPVPLEKASDVPEMLRL